MKNLTWLDVLEIAPLLAIIAALLALLWVIDWPTGLACTIAAPLLAWLGCQLD